MSVSILFLNSYVIYAFVLFIDRRKVISYSILSLMYCFDFSRKSKIFSFKYNNASNLNYLIEKSFFSPCAAFPKLCYFIRPLETPLSDDIIPIYHIYLYCLYASHNKLYLMIIFEIYFVLLYLVWLV